MIENQKTKAASAMEDVPMQFEDDGDKAAAKKGGGKKRLSVERIYQKKTQLEHILLRPDTYIGSTEPVKQVRYMPAARPVEF